MAKRSKQEKQQPNFILFLVEGESDILALETSLSELIYNKYPDYEVRFLLQHKYLSPCGEEFDCDDEEDNDANNSISDNEFVTGGDITTSSYVTPQNIEQKITSRFIMPAVKKEGIYPKKIAKIIQIIDLDAAYIPDERITPFSAEHKEANKLFYNTAERIVETDNVEGIIERNKRKRSNIDYLFSLSSRGIKIKSKTIPYEAYFFSSNLDHFINNDANVQYGKRRLARDFLEKYGLYTNAFCNYFINDMNAVGSIGYTESWDWIRSGLNSISRSTNIDCLIRRLTE